MMGLRTSRHRLRPTRSLLAISIIIACTLPSSAWSGLPLARLKSVFPAGGQAGTSVDVTVTGDDLDNAAELTFSHPGFSAALKSQKPTERTFTVKIAADAPVGIYDLRTVGRFGISNPRAFAVGDLPEVTADPRKSGGTHPSIEVEFGSLVNGRCAINCADRFAVALKKGQRLLARCETLAIDSRLEPILEILNPAGQEAARRDGGLLDYTAADDGKYIIQVHDILYRGGTDYGYRLAIGSVPHVDFIFPPAGEAGKRCRFDLYGRNLPGGRSAGRSASDGTQLEKLTVELDVPAAAPADGEVPTFLEPAAVTLDGFVWRYRSASGTSNPTFIGISRREVLVEKEPNDDPTAALKLTPPFDLAGEFFPNRDRDWISFDAKKGETWWIELISDRRNQPTGPYMLLQRLKPGSPTDGAEDVKELTEPEQSNDPGGPSFRTCSRDPPPYRLEVKEDATYRFMIRDLFNGSQPTAGLVYRLSVRRAAPDFRIVSLASPPVAEGNVRKNKKADADKGADAGMLLRKGGVAAFRILVLRQDGFAGAVQLGAVDLPPGVACDPVTVAANAQDATLFLKADDNCPAASGPLHIVGRAKIGDAEVAREARAGIVLWGASNANEKQAIDSLQSRLAGNLVIAVSDEEYSPLSIAIGDGKLIEVAPAGKITIPVKLMRRGDSVQSVVLKLAGITAVADAKELSIEAGADQGVIELDLAQKKLPPGTYQIYVSARAQIKHLRPAIEGEDAASPKGGSSKKTDIGKKKEPTEARADFFSTPVALKVLNPIEVQTDPAPIEIVAGSNAEVSVRINRLDGFDEPVSISLTALGEANIIAKKASLAKGQVECKLAINAKSNATVGEQTATVVASTKLGKQDITVEQQVKINVKGN